MDELRAAATALEPALSIKGRTRDCEDALATPSWSAFRSCLDDVQHRLAIFARDRTNLFLFARHHRNLCCGLRALVPCYRGPSYRALPQISLARGRGRRNHLDSGQCGQASPETCFVAFSRCSSITVGNGPKVIEHNGPKPHRFRQVPVLMRPKGQGLPAQNAPAGERRVLRHGSGRGPHTSAATVALGDAVPDRPMVFTG